MTNPQKANDWFKQGNSHHEAKRYEEALRCYDQAVKIDPANTRAWDNRGLCFANLNRHAEAIPCYDKALQIDPKNVAGWCNRGISLIALNRNEEALQCFDKAINLDAQHAIIWEKKGDSLRNLGRREEAIICYDTTVKLDAKNAIAWYNKASCEDELGRNNDAIYSYQQFLNLAPVEDASFIQHSRKRMTELNTKANPFEDNKNNTAASGITISASHPNPQTAMPSLQTGSTFHSDIERPAQQPKEVHGLDAEYWSKKGKELIDQENFEEALSCFDNALKLESRSAYEWYKKGVCEEHLRRAQDAIHSYKRVLEFSNEHQAGLIITAKQRLAELEDNQKPAMNYQEDAMHHDLPAELTKEDVATGHVYQPGEMIGEKYEVRGILGHGGFGVVYLVSVRELSSVELPKHGPFIPFALKTINPEHLADVKARERFLKEANIWVELEKHSYIVHAYAVDEISGQLFIWIDYIAPNEQGINNLADYLNRRPPTLVQSLRWAIQVSYAMEYAYSKGVRAHRDLKPENIMINQEGNALVTDFGLAGILDLSHSRTDSPLTVGSRAGTWAGQTQMGEVFGTPTHMSPEQFTDFAHCDERSDIYSFGVVLFQLASGGQLPFDLSEGNWQAWYTAHSQAPVPHLNSPLFPMIQRCLEKEPGKRYQHFAQLRSELKSLLKRQTGEAVELPWSGNALKDWNGKGENLDSLGRYEEALQCYDKALKSDKRNAYAWSNKSISLKKLGRNEEALQCCDEALKIEPQMIEALINKGSSLINLGRYQEALHCSDKALEINSDCEPAWVNKGSSLSGLGRPEEALHCCDQALKIDPNSISAWHNKSLYLTMLDRYEESLQCCNRALGIAPLNKEAWNVKGYILDRLGRREEALPCYDKALEIDLNI